jgi:hypothetical protein
MAKKELVDLFVDDLAEAGVRQINNVSGGSPNGITDSIPAKKQIQWANTLAPPTHGHVCAFFYDLDEKYRLRQDGQQCPEGSRRVDSREPFRQDRLATKR